MEIPSPGMEMQNFTGKTIHNDHPCCSIFGKLHEVDQCVIRPMDQPTWQLFFSMEKSWLNPSGDDHEKFHHLFFFGGLKLGMIKITVGKQFF